MAWSFKANNGPCGIHRCLRHHLLTWMFPLVCACDPVPGFLSVGFVEGPATHHAQAQCLNQHVADSISRATSVIDLAYNFMHFPLPVLLMYSMQSTLQLKSLIYFLTLICIFPG